MSKNKKPTLGKGLNEIFGGDVQEVIDNITKKRTNGVAAQIDLDKLVANPYQPRKQFDEEELQGLAQSIKENGLFTPILVKENEVGNYYIVAGERRTRAAKLAGLKTISAITADISDIEMQRITLVENIQRSDLNPIEMATSIKVMIENQDLTQEEVSKIIGKSRSYVTNLLNILNLNKKITDGVLNGKVSYGHVRPLITLSEKDAAAIHKTTLEKGLTVREVENYSRAAKLREARANKEPKPVSKKEEELLYAEELVRNKLRSKVIISSNEIKIKYKGREQLSRILERMNAVEK